MMWMAQRPATAVPTVPLMPPLSSVLSVRTSSPVLVGRDTELTTLVELVTERPSAVLLEGEAGMGKTRLVQELLRRPELAGTRVLTGSCQPLREPFPYGPVLEALRGVADFPIGPLSPVAGVLRPLLPEIADLLPPRPQPLADTAAERHREFRAIRELLGACGPALLVIDDLHWADERTRDLLWFVLSRPPEQLGVVVTYRSEDLRTGGPLGVPYRPAEGVRAARVQLGPLDVPAVRMLASTILDAPRVAEEFAAKLHESTAGIPFVVEETLRALRGPAGAVEVDRATGHRLLDSLEVPVLLREAMTERMSTLSDTSVRVARSAAVLGVPAEISLLGALAGLRGRPLSTALAQALDAGVLREVTRDRYGFRHALAMKSVYDAISGPERQLLHARAMRALAATEPPPLVQLAGHAKAAGRIGEWQRYAEAAADQAVELGETSLAIDALQAVLDGTTPAAEDAGRMAEKLSRVALRGLRPDVTRTLEKVIGQYELSPVVRGTIRMNTGLLLVRKSGELSRGRAAVQKAIDELAGDPELAARGINLLAQPIDGTTPLAWHQRWMDRARQVHDQLDDPELRLALTADRIAGRAHIGDGSAWDEFERFKSEAGEVAVTVAERVQQARFWCNLADAGAWVGHFDRAALLLKDGLRIANCAGALFVTGNGQSTRARLDWLTGNWSGLAESAEALREKYRDLAAITSESALVLAGLACVRGEFEEAEKHLAATNLLNPDQGVMTVVLSAAGMLSRVRLAAGDLPGACAAADHGMATARRKEIWVWAAELVPSAVDAYVHAGRLDDAERAIEDFARGIAGRDAPAASAGLASAQAVLLAAQGKHAEAAERFASARELADAMPMPYLAHWARERGALSRLEAGDTSIALTELSAAADGYETLGAARDAGRCRHRLREHGAWAPSQRGRRGYGQQLSPREKEVAEMLAAGRTNREIANGLFLSPRTVEQHVANVLRKLGARSRTEVGRKTSLNTYP
ncbi:AAA family ATPase [Amycolatopsis sp. 195334CR]|uniref:helix-turn-helix transcriptional regulator n=1 Tax=Amycolatopsis sp. 195334CR TaxID=2814588 RepID=UPI0027DBEC54|nr:AAA family ATPase [Amycolatopsis sp. 195334CR]